jgi:hypothetical protein
LICNAILRSYHPVQGVAGRLNGNYKCQQDNHQQCRYEDKDAFEQVPTHNNLVLKILNKKVHDVNAMDFAAQGITSLFSVNLPA